MSCVWTYLNILRVYKREEWWDDLGWEEEITARHNIYLFDDKKVDDKILNITSMSILERKAKIIEGPVYKYFQLL